MSISVLLVDDHAVVLNGLTMFLGLDPELAIVGRAANGAEAVRLAHELLPDVVLMDLLMPVMDGITATTIIRRELPEVEVVALTSVLDDDKVIGAIRAGAIGYLLKDTEADELRRAIKAAAAGQVQLSPQVVERLLREVKTPDSPRLGDYEQEILRLVARGRSNGEIAQELKVGEKAVKNLVGGILSKLGVPSRTQAALYALRTGLVTLEETALN
ncbi:Transcriptional regulatory protein LiaR [Candidatus Promineifilum breve]|uniref:Transcriptional regulatory protein LiaR n=1 Tax=Candidatus Promineifilum breve TaxID=1806508 RepID=A0A160T5D8_9CHLR|nr:response regulator transcription factor [Candidatus Promineifilum breve]CUS05591.1 Transcriptional regulatory protein LiaR [Candidatus Promineifilum breve]